MADWETQYLGKDRSTYEYERAFQMQYLQQRRHFINPFEEARLNRYEDTKREVEAEVKEEEKEEEIYYLLT